MEEEEVIPEETVVPEVPVTEEPVGPTIPVEPTVQELPQYDAETYTVVKGDSLWKIARKYLGKGARYTEIFELNKDKISNPNYIYPSQVLVMPAR